MRTGSDAEVAIRAADAACEVIRHSYGGAVERFDKGDGDFATG
jgi:myo-inositol-1(or 4)-monophosphatase